MKLTFKQGGKLADYFFLSVTLIRLKAQFYMRKRRMNLKLHNSARQTKLLQLKEENRRLCELRDLVVAVTLNNTGGEYDQEKLTEYDGDEDVICLSNESATSYLCEDCIGELKSVHQKIKNRVWRRIH